MKRKPATKKKITQKAYGKIDWIMVIIVAILIAYGLLMLYSASSYNASIEGKIPSYYVLRQLIFVFIGFIFMTIVTFIPYSFWKKTAIPIFILSLIAILLVLSPLGFASHGAKRWLNFGFTTVQPSEILKIAVVLFTALVITNLKQQTDDIKTFLIIISGCVVGAGLTAFITDDLGTAIIILAMGFLMVYVSCPKVKYLVLSVIAIIILGGAYVLIRPNKLQRIEAWLNIDKYSDSIGYQITQGLYAIGSGGIFGKGLGQGTQKLGFVPESENDMIFSIICEELGLIGALFLLALFVLLLWRMKKIFDNSTDLYAKCIVVGISSHIAVQTFINLAVVTNLIPNTGVPLPFISYGGSAIFFLLIEIGLVLSVGRNTEVIKVDLEKRDEYYQKEKNRNPATFL